MAQSNKHSGRWTLRPAKVCSCGTEKKFNISSPAFLYGNQNNFKINNNSIAYRLFDHVNAILQPIGHIQAHLRLAVVVKKNVYIFKVNVRQSARKFS